MNLLRNYYRAEEAEEDNYFYTDRALLIRESMRFNPEIRHALENIWAWADKDGNGTIDEEEYCRLFLMLCKILWPRDKLRDTPRSQINDMAKEEFKQDCLGKEVLDKTRFMQSFFQLVSCLLLIAWL